MIAPSIFVACYFRLFTLYRRSRLFFQLIFLADLAQVFRAVKAVKEKDTVQVINFVLKHTREPAFGIHLDVFASYILSLNYHFFGPANVFNDVTGNTEAALYSQHFTFGFDNFRVSHGDRAVFKFRDKKTDGLRDLRGC